MNDEHVIPKSLGGFRSTVIRSSAKLNSMFATTIDARVADDPLIIFGRRDANARGHSRKQPIPRLRGAQAWKAGEPFRRGEAPYTIEIPGNGSAAKVWDRRTRSYLSPGVFHDTGFIIYDFNIDHTARLKFTVKTLLGVGWKFFGADLLQAVDVEFLRSLLVSDFEIGEGVNDGALSYTDPVLARQGSSDQEVIQGIERALVRNRITTILMREFEGSLEWSVACVGNLVGSVRTKVNKPLIYGDVKPRGGIRLEMMREGVRPVLLEPFD
jgi:hypothetical protein